MLAAGVLVFLAALGTRTSSLAYIDQTTYEAAMIDDHPDDPTTVYYMALAARKGGQPERARTWLTQMPEPPWPVAIVERVGSLANEYTDDEVCERVHGQLESWLREAKGGDLREQLRDAAEGLECESK